MEFSKLTYGQIESLAETLNSSSASMETLLTEIKTLFNHVGSEDVWAGTAAASTREEFDQLSAKFPEFSEAIADCYKYLTNVVKNYKAVDSAIMGNK